jgi:hypothetical protein
MTPRLTKCENRVALALLSDADSTRVNGTVVDLHVSPTEPTGVTCSS